MPQLRLKDLNRSSDIGVILGPAFCGFYAPDNDIEVGFSREDGRAILTLIQVFLRAESRPEAPDFLMHRFKNLDDIEVPDYENAAFLIRERAEGIELTVSNWLQSDDVKCGDEIGGISICVSRTDVGRLAGEFETEMRMLVSGVRSTGGHPIHE